MLRKIKEFIHESTKYDECTEEERKEIDEAITKVERRLLGLESTNANLKEKLEKNYRNIPWR